MKVDFFIVGAPKAGTTSLYHYLNEHPQIVMSTQKETDFFSDEALQKQAMYYGKNRINSIEKYHALFPQQANKIFGEASVSYLFYEDVPSKIKAYNPNGKIIILLRNPIDRAFSHYLMDVRLGLNNADFEQVLLQPHKTEKTRLLYQQYIELSLYYNQVKRYIDTFGKENVAVFFYQELKDNSTQLIQKLYHFLQVDDTFLPAIEQKHNTFSMPKNKMIRKIYSFVWLRNVLKLLFPSELVRKLKSSLFRKDKKPTLSEQTKDELFQIFKQDIVQLEKLLMTDLSRWKR